LFQECEGYLADLEQRVDASPNDEPPLWEVLLQRVEDDGEFSDFLRAFGEAVHCIEVGRGPTWSEFLAAASERFRGPLLLELFSLDREQRWQLVERFWVPGRDEDCDEDWLLNFFEALRERYDCDREILEACC